CLRRASRVFPDRHPRTSSLRTPMNLRTSNHIDIVAATTSAEMDRFITLPARLLARDPHHVTPLVLERREALSPKKNPFFEHAQAKFWLARRDGRDVGRISAQVDRLAPDPHVGHFGMIAAEGDAAVPAPPFPAAGDWRRRHGRARALGALSPSV